MRRIPDAGCSIARSVGVLGERWTFLVLREAIGGTTRFSEFRRVLGVAPDVLAERLNTLVEYGAMRRAPYREPGRRVRSCYELTAAGRELSIVLAALQQWGDEHLPRPEGPTVLRRVAGTDRPVRVGFVDEHGLEVDHRRVAMIPSPVHPARLKWSHEPESA